MKFFLSSSSLAVLFAPYLLLAQSSASNIPLDAKRVLPESEYATAVCGGATFKCVPKTQEAPKTATYGVRCCSETAIPQSKLKPGCSVYGASRVGDPWACRTSATFQEAVDYCAASGARLCTQEELLGKCAKSTGCGLNLALVWSSGPEETSAPTKAPVPATDAPVPATDAPVPATDAPVTSPGSASTYCCSHDLKTCAYGHDPGNWCDQIESNCLGSCNGYWVESDSNCGLPLWGLCTADEDCCDPSICFDHGLYKDCQIVEEGTSPISTPAPTDHPTQSPIAPTPVNDYCCSTNLLDCTYTNDPTNWCNQNESQCVGCGAHWVEENNNCGIPNWGTCTDNEGGCCHPAVCVDQGTYKQCLI